MTTTSKRSRRIAREQPVLRYLTIDVLYRTATMDVGTVQSKYFPSENTGGGNSDILKEKLRSSARSRFLRKKTLEVLGSSEINLLWALLEKHHTPPAVNDNLLINFVDFQHVRKQLSESCQKILSPVLFAKLLSVDPLGRVTISSIFNYVMKKAWLLQTRIGLCLYDATFQGALRECDLECYIIDLIPTLTQLNILQRSFYSFYACVAVRKFFFFLDPNGMGRISITDILASGFLDELLALRDDHSSPVTEEKNWFSAQSSLEVYGLYLSLDSDKNGLLSAAELSHFGTGTLTPAFLDRLFQVVVTYDGEMDFKVYLDFVLAMQNPQEPQTLQYFFRVLDVHGSGYLDLYSIHLFFREIQVQLERLGQEVVSLKNFADELFDMVKPTTPNRITLRDLVESRQGASVVSMLTDVEGFLSHENRESQYVVQQTV